MMMLSVIPLLLAVASAVTVAAASDEFTVQHVAVLDNYLVENLAVRQNGRVLVTTSAPAATLWQINPLTNNNATLVAHFPGVSGSYGITELQTDVFYVTTGNFSIQTRKPVAQSFKLFEVDMTAFRQLPNGSVASPPKLREVTTLTDAIVLNGLTHVDGQDGYVLAADSYAGLIWKVDVTTGNVTTAIKDSSMDPSASQAAGINGLKYQSPYLYYTNTGANAYYRVPIHPENATASGPPQLLAQVVKPDDLILDDSGTAYICQQANALSQVSLNGTQQVLAGTLNSNTSSLLGPTAAAWARTVNQKILYITTNGGQSAASASTPGAQGLSEINLSSDTSVSAPPSQTSASPSSTSTSTSGSTSSTPSSASSSTSGGAATITFPSLLFSSGISNRVITLLLLAPSIFLFIL